MWNITSPEVEVDFDFDGVELNEEGDRIISIIPAILVNGDIDDELTNQASNIFYKFI